MHQVQEWINRATPSQQQEARRLCSAIGELLAQAERMREGAPPQLRPILKAVAGHLRWAEKGLRGWLTQNT